MGGSVSQVFRSGSALLTHRDGKVGNIGHLEFLLQQDPDYVDNNNEIFPFQVSESTIDKVQSIFEILRTNPKVSIHTLDVLLGQIAKYENILAVHDESGYNLLQRATGLNHVDLVRWLLHRHCLDVNRSPCSLPLHIACVKGYEDCVELLLKHGARIDTEARMCFPGPHSSNCEERGKYKAVNLCEPTTTKLQNALAYAIDGDHINVLNMLSQKMEEPWVGQSQSGLCAVTDWNFPFRSPFARNDPFSTWPVKGALGIVSSN